MGIFIAYLDVQWNFSFIVVALNPLNPWNNIYAVYLCFQMNK